MENFWESRTGAPITGNASDAYQPQFESIPNGTTAPAMIKAFELTSKQINGVDTDFYNITWKITSGDFKGREVPQKIKAFDHKPEIAQRALNMLKLIYDLVGHKPTHKGVPTNDDHKPLIGKILGIKIGEWQMPKTKEPGFLTGNNVTQVHKIDADFKTEVGVKRELPKITTSAVESALTRNANMHLDDDLPF
jgi:hypothetical protein